MSFDVRFTEEALADLNRFCDFLLEHGGGDMHLAERALEAIGSVIALLGTSPFAGKIQAGEVALRELVIGFGEAGYVALYEIEDDTTVTVLALRHQREDDCG